MALCRMLALSVGIAAALAVSFSHGAPINRGTLTAALAGNDLTDLGNNGVEGSYTYPAGVFPANLGNFDATFFASAEASFGAGEAAFNVFDNVAQGGGDSKWCCNPVSDAVDGLGHFVGADFSQTLATGQTSIVLNRFTIASGNDSPDRDPDVWSIQGSNDGTTWTNIFSYNVNGTTPFASRDQVLEYSVANGDFSTPTGFKQFRLFVDSLNGSTLGLQLDELEFFGNLVVVPEPTSVVLWSLIGAAATVMAWRNVRRKR